MGTPVRLREDFSAADLRAFAKASRCSDQTRRLLALAEIYDGGTRSDAARLGGVGLQTVRDWVLAFNAEGADGLRTGQAPGKTPLLGPAERQALAEIIDQGPMPAIHGVVRWRLVDLMQWLFDEFKISVSKQTLSRELRAMGFRKLSARPRHHAQDTAALEAFKKTSPPAWRKSPTRKRRESP